MSDRSTLIFRRYGNEYFFAQAWIDGDSEGLSAPSSRSERATRKEMAALGVKTEMIALADARSSKTDSAADRNRRTPLQADHSHPKSRGFG